MPAVLAAPANDGLHPTAGTLLVIIQQGAAAAGDAGREALAMVIARIGDDMRKELNKT
jgi:hypothetical protein